MKFQLERILEVTRRGQWSIDDIDWNTPVPEIAAMPDDVRREAGTTLLMLAGMERQAAYVFDLCARHVDDPTAAKIYALFRDDEYRHAEAEERLAARYGVTEADLPLGVKAMFGYMTGDNRYNEAHDPRVFFEYGSSYVVLFELALDTVIMPALQRLTTNPLQAEIFRRLDQDEARHIAMDYWLLEKKGQSPAERIKTLATELRQVPYFFALLTGFGSFLASQRHLRTEMLAPLLIKRYVERVLRIDSLSPSAQEVSSYRLARRGQRRMLRGATYLNATLSRFRPSARATRAVVKQTLLALASR